MLEWPTYSASRLSRLTFNIYLQMIPYATPFPICTTPQVMETYSSREPTDCFCSSYTSHSLSVPSGTSGGYPVIPYSVNLSYWSWSRNKEVYPTKALETYSSREPTDCFHSPNTCLRLQVLFLFSYRYRVTLNCLIIYIFKRWVFIQRHFNDLLPVAICCYLLRPTG